MRRLIYVSTSCIGTDETALSTIVRDAAARNAAASVTGMLWANEHGFVQALEGDDAAVEDTMKRIRLDSRHCDVAVIYDRPVSSRLFGSWTMTRADSSPACTEKTAFIVGYARLEGGAPARRAADMLVDA
jgi:hypothetical protein